MARNVEEFVIQLRDKFTPGLNKAEKGLDRMRGKAEQTHSSFSKLSGLAARIGAGFIAAQAIKSVVSLGVEMEQTRVAFSTFLGSADKGNAVIAKLNEFSNVTPFDNAQVIKSGKVLLAFGTTTEKLIPTLKTIGDISAATGKDFNELTTIYGKAKIAGKLMAEDINQLVEAGVPIISEFAKQFGVTEDQVKKLGSEGKISFANLEKAFQDMTGEGGQFFDLMAKQSQTVGGKFSTLLGKMQVIGIGMGEALLPVLGVLVDFGIAITENLDVLGTVAIAVGVAAVAWAAMNVPLAITIIQTKLMAASVWLLNAALAANPIGLVITAIAALTIGLIAAWRHSEQFRASIMGIFSAVKQLGANVTSVFQGIGSIIQAVITGNFDVIPGLVKKTFDSVKNIGLGVGDAFGEGFAREMFTGQTPINPEAPFSPLASLRKTTDKAGGVTTAAAGAGSGVKAGISEIRSSAPKQINITIEKLIEGFSVNTQTLPQSAAKIKEEVARALLAAVNDVNVIQG